MSIQHAHTRVSHIKIISVYQVHFLSLHDASLELIEEDKPQRSMAQESPALTLYPCSLLWLSKGGNDGVMINTGPVWRSKSLSPAKINHPVSQRDGRHTSRLIEHAKGHRFFPLRL